MYWANYFVFGFYSANGQQRLAPDIYIVKFTDKNSNSFTTSNPSAFLSQRATERRSKQGIQIDLTDLPVSKVYTDSLTQAGFTIQNTSKPLRYKKNSYKKINSAKLTRLLLFPTLEDTVEDIVRLPFITVISCTIKDLAVKECSLPFSTVVLTMLRIIHHFRNCGLKKGYC